MKCKNCIFWREKSWVTDQGIGICDNSKVIEQVTTMSKEFVNRFIKDERDAQMIASSIRFNSEFGCIHFSNIIEQDTLDNPV